MWATSSWRWLSTPSSGQRYEQMIRSLVIDPLGLSRTIMPTDPPVSEMPDPYMHCLFDPYNEGTYTDFSTMYIEWDRGAGDIISDMGDLNDFPPRTAKRADRRGHAV